MTSRIHEDGNGTEAKWADIDDDEDDWAPETIEWNDGTKITLAHTETLPAPNQDVPRPENAKDNATPDQPPGPETSRILFAKSPTTVGPNATVLRVGASAERQQQQAKAAISARSGNDRAILTAKSQAPVPMKSPWAALPRVEGASPVNPPVQSTTFSRFPHREQLLPDNFASSMPTREIAADDFNRSWRDGHSNVPRELYNSQSGRYEPVPDTRKGSLKNDSQMRPPALLQRSIPNDPAGPAEPSAAFQTHRSSHQESGHWGRRRASSNLSGGSGSYGRRMSFGRLDGPGKLHDTRRGSLVNGFLDHSTSPSEASFSKDIAPGDVSPNQPSTSSGWQPRGAANAPGSNSGTAQVTTAALPEEQGSEFSPAEDPVAMQQRIMKEKNLEARRRRLEQEQKEEAERKERIRLKLEAMGPPPEKEKAKSDDPVKITTTNDVNVQPTTHPVIQSPPKPPVPEPTGEPKQYGMMKVHHPESVKKLVAASERVPEKPSVGAAPSRHPLSPAGDVKVDVIKLNGISPHDEPQKLPEQMDTALDDSDAQWRGNLNKPSSYSPWGPGAKLSSHTSPGSNLWKPLSSDKTLGNGTFDRNLASFSPRELSLRGTVGLSESSPIGPVSSNAPRLAQDQAPLASLPPPSEPSHSGFEPFQPIARPKPIGPPGAHSNHWQADSRRSVQPATSAWNNFQAVAANKDAEESEKFQRELSARRDEPAPPLQVNFNETWRQVRSGDQVGQRQVIGVAKSSEPPSADPSLHGFNPSVDALPFRDTHTRPFSNVTGRGSRFFPPTVELPMRAVNGDDGRTRSPSPPPPEELSSHPAFTGLSNRPLVHLPTPKPVVKLPPKANPLPPKAVVTFASMAATSARAQVPSVTSWQDRINGLFGKKVSPQRKKILAVTSATKEPLDVQSHPSPAAVSFPRVREGGLQVQAGRVTSKEVEEEEEIFEDREVGSLPVVRVPVMAPPNAWLAAPAPPARLRPKTLKSTQVHSIEPFILGLFDKDNAGNPQVLIHFPGSESTKTVALPRKIGSPGSRHKGTSSFRTRKNTKARDSSGSLHGSQISKRQNSATHTKASTSPSHGSFTQASWGPRASTGVAH